MHCKGPPPVLRACRMPNGCPSYSVAREDAVIAECSRSQIKSPPLSFDSLSLAFCQSQLPRLDASRCRQRPGVPKLSSGAWVTLRCGGLAGLSPRAGLRAHMGAFIAVSSLLSGSLTHRGPPESWPGCVCWHAWTPATTSVRSELLTPSDPPLAHRTHNWPTIPAGARQHRLLHDTIAPSLDPSWNEWSSAGVCRANRRANRR